MAKRGGFPGGGMPGNMNNLMKQAQRMQSQMEEAQNELETKEVTATAGGGVIEEIGTYNPVSEPKEVKIDTDSAVKWLHNGAKPSDTVRKLLSDQGVMERFHNEKLENRKNN